MSKHIDDTAVKARAMGESFNAGVFSWQTSISDDTADSPIGAGPRSVCGLLSRKRFAMDRALDRCPRRWRVGTDVPARVAAAHRLHGKNIPLDGSLKHRP